MSNDHYETFDRTSAHAFPDERLLTVLERLDGDSTIQAYLDAQNVNPVDRLGYNDHGPKHVEIVTNRALGLYELLKEADVECNGAGDQGLAESDEAVIIAIAAILHDIGHVVHRDRHAHWSIPLAADLIDDIVGDLYEPVALVKLKAEILHAIVCHHAEERPLTVEAGCVRIADGLDMEHGRSREPYESGGRGINTVSSRAIRAVRLCRGDEHPVAVEIEMINAAGVYQVDTLLKAKLEGSGLEDLVSIVAINVSRDDDQIVERLEL